MANDDLSVRRASDQAVRTLRTEDLGSGVQGQVVLTSDGPEKVPTLTGATLGLISVTNAAAVALDPPDAGARVCLVRAWHTAYDQQVRLFYRRDGTNPTNSGNNCEGYLMHGEARVVRLATLTNFKVIAESGTWQITCEYSNT